MPSWRRISGRLFVCTLASPASSGGGAEDFGHRGGRELACCGATSRGAAVRAAELDRGSPARSARRQFPGRDECARLIAIGISGEGSHRQLVLVLPPLVGVPVGSACARKEAIGGRRAIEAHACEVADRAQRPSGLARKSASRSRGCRRWMSANREQVLLRRRHWAATTSSSGRPAEVAPARHEQDDHGRPASPADRDR